MKTRLSPRTDKNSKKSEHLNFGFTQDMSCQWVHSFKVFRNSSFTLLISSHSALSIKYENSLDKIFDKYNSLAEFIKESPFVACALPIFS